MATNDDAASPTQSSTDHGTHSPAAPDGVDVLLSDGRIARVRLAQPSDQEELRQLHQQASDENIYRRFFSVSRVTADHFVSRVCAIDAQMTALVAVVDGAICGLATAENNGPMHAEVSIFVADAMHGCGVGTRLLEQLVATMETQEVIYLDAEVLTTNTGMLEVFAHMGYKVTSQRDRSTVELQIDPQLSDTSMATAAARERIAEQASLSRVLRPSSVAVVGVSRHRGGVGREVVENILAGGFTGRVYAVTPHPLELSGAEVIATLTEIDEPIDLVVAAVPMQSVEAVVIQAGRQGAKGCVILAAGFGEADAEGLLAQARIVDTARRYGMRLVGPNCLGLVSNLGESKLDASFAATGAPAKGGLAVATQSGGVAIAIADEAAKRHLGLATWVSLGNQADVGARDLLAAWADDSGVEAAAVYLESTAEARAFARVAREFADRKPLVVLFGGDSQAGRRAGVSHTATSATSANSIAALVEMTGIIQVHDVDQLVDVASLLIDQPLPAGPRLGIVGNAGGLGVLAADRAAADGLDVPKFDTGADGISNPHDVGAGAGTEQVCAAVATLAGEVDGLILIVAATATNDVAGCVEAVEKLLGEHPRLPVALVAPGAAIDSVFTTFPSVGRAIRAMSHASSYAAWLRRPHPSSVEPDRLRSVEVRALAASYLTRSAGAGWLRADDAFGLLTPYALPVPPWRLADDPTTAVTAADSIGYPVVAKLCDPETVHKTELGYVLTNLTDSVDVEAAARRLHRHDQTHPILIQGQVASGTELALGVVREAQMGPLVMLATGGVDLEVWADPVFLMPPLTPDRVRMALRRLRSWPLLEGHRGGRGVDLQRLVDLVCEVGQLAMELPELAELDINPVVARPEGIACVDIKVRLAPSTSASFDAAPTLSRPPMPILSSSDQIEPVHQPKEEQ